ncbi:predicted protein [Naegleria gruberi]|uniref:Predicted protein n=1 Tax=Naegleria gruberi TaxID=5762 RepID=D2VLT8_NAEGR|nr:uncharacterized protein NAEGRDRAFT_69896 [Naegleria gruberi]EFC42200.1 predicted protein [Naegleria gruberi]|eukprot:XP_002674944.1 predicted protein [Naegleria gruberi strain NEG-M]
MSSSTSKQFSFSSQHVASSPSQANNNNNNLNNNQKKKNNGKKEKEALLMEYGTTEIESTFGNIFSSSSSDVKNNSSKAFHTACCFIAPTEIWEPIQEMRSVMDKAYERWPPHINFLFPFIPEQYFEQAQELIREKLARVEPFDITFSGVNYFAKNSSVMWLDQDEESIKKLQQVQALIAELFPYCDEKKNEKGEFVPHLTVGQQALKFVEKKVKELNSKWKPVTVRVNEVCLIYRPDKETSFSVIHRVPLGPGL